MKKSLKWTTVIFIIVTGIIIYFLYPPEPRTISFPGGKRFAFSIIDDTDLVTLEQVKPLYELLHQYGIRTTKTVWVLETNDSSHAPNKGQTLQDSIYREFILDLQRKGFEIALHGVRGGSSPRSEIVNGLEEFKRVLGQYPNLHVNHSLNRDNVYWGEDRWFFAPFKWSYALVSNHDFSGEEKNSVYFWGDLVKAHIQYVNRFTFGNINLLDVNPTIPYRPANKPYLNYNFPTADGENFDRFVELLKAENLDQLEQEGGVCLVYSHLGAGSFRRDDETNPEFELRLKDLASRNGWFAPASEILDYLRAQPGWRTDLSFRERVRLDVLFIWYVVVTKILPAP